MLSSLHILLHLIGPQHFEEGSELHHHCVSKALNSAWYIIGTQNLLNQIKFHNQECITGASLVVQWLRIACQCRGHGFEPWSGKIPHATEQLSPCATTTEPAL